MPPWSVQRLFHNLYFLICIFRRKYIWLGFCSSPEEIILVKVRHYQQLVSELVISGCQALGFFTFS